MSVVAFLSPTDGVLSAVVKSDVNVSVVASSSVTDGTLLTVVASGGDLSVVASSSVTDGAMLTVVASGGGFVCPQVVICLLGLLFVSACPQLVPAPTSRRSLIRRFRLKGHRVQCGKMAEVYPHGPGRRLRARTLAAGRGALRRRRSR